MSMLDMAQTLSVRNRCVDAVHDAEASAFEMLRPDGGR